MDINTLFTVLGVLGACCAVSAYFLIQTGYFKDSSVGFYGLNAIGALLVTIGVVYDFDGGDIGALGQEVCWIAISIAGIIKYLRNKPA